MLRAVPDHPKFAGLKARLGKGKGETAGYLETTWHFTGRFTPRGNIGKYTDAQIEGWIEWPGEPGELIDALVAERWLDRDPVYRLIVHDWHIHADKATKLALSRAKQDFVRPTRDLGPTTSGHHTNTVRTEGSLPAPEPAPEPAPVPEPAPSQHAESLAETPLARSLACLSAYRSGDP